MKICFVQPNNKYQVESNRLSFSLTFPQMICNMGLEAADYYIYIDGKMEKDFASFLLFNSITHVFITSITSTFPRATALAKCAHDLGCMTVLGGIFATLTSEIIKKYYNCYDYIIRGGMNREALEIILNHKRNGIPEIISIPKIDVFDKPLWPIMLNPSFQSSFDSNLYVCYELGDGCIYDCSFCTLRKAFGSTYKPRKLNVIQQDLYHLATIWSKLKLIDDDIYQSQNALAKLDFSQFDEIIIETRINHLDENFLKICKSKGVTHIITGIESLNNDVLIGLNKCPKNNWNYYIERAIDLCNKYSIILRPVIMINPPNACEKDLDGLIAKTEQWIPENNIEVLISMYTPHPGMIYPQGILLSNDLSLFDHLHHVFMPQSLQETNPTTIMCVYEQIVSQTHSRRFNPYVDLKRNFIGEYAPFFDGFYDNPAIVPKV